MSRKYKFDDSKGLYFISFATVYWIDVFIRNEYKDILLDSWRHCISKEGLEVYAWCIMTSHAHMIISSHGQDMDNIVGKMKSFTATSLKKAILSNPEESRKEWMIWMMQRAGTKTSNTKDFQLWQHHNKPIVLYTNPVIDQKLDYIHNNPVEAGFVDKPEFYLYSSARDYAGEKGLLKELLLL